MSVKEKLTAIADAIRDKTKKTELLTLDDMVTGVSDVYDSGKTKEWGDFWDSFQENGNKTNYARAFAGKGWTDDNWSPKYDIRPTGDAYGMFWTNPISDMGEILKRNDVVFDTSNVTHGQMMIFDMPNLVHLGEFDIGKMINCSDTFAVNYKLEKIDKVIFSPTTKCDTGNSMFRANGKLTSVGFEGTLAYSLNVKDPPFDKPTIISLINILSVDTTGLTVTLKKSAVNKAFETSSGANNGSTSAEWLALVATKQNWTISLV